jgi:hypothetical protein
LKVFNVSQEFAAILLALKILKIETAGFPETLATAHETTQCHTIEDHNVYFHRRIILK